MQQWQQSVEHQLVSITQAVTPPQSSAPGLCEPAPPVVSSTTEPACTGISFPDSGFESTSEQQPTQEDSFLLSSGTTDSLKTVRALSPVFSSCAGGAGVGVESPDCSLLEQYLSSVQQREEEAEEGIASDRTETPQPSSPVSPSKTAETNSPLQNVADNRSEEAGTQEAAPGPV